MNQLPLLGNPNRLEDNELSGLRIPLGKEVQQIALAFASEQENVAKGKQVFLNTLSVIAVHKCLKWFGIQSYLESTECWQKIRRAMFNVADLLVEEWGRVECFPILPEQTFIDLSPDLLENRRGFIGVQFHQHFNFVEMFGFKFLDETIKSKLEKSLSLNIQNLQPFENIFNYVEPCPLSQVCQSEDWISFENLGLRRLTFANLQNNAVDLSFFGKLINLNNYQIILGAALEFINEENRNIVFEIFNKDKDLQLPKDLTITVLSDQGIVGNFNQLLIGDNYRFEMKFKNLSLGTIFTLIFSCKNFQVANRFIV